MLPVYLINLDRSADRLAHMAGEFARVGATFTRFPAFDASVLSREEAGAWIGKRPGFAAGGWLIGDVGAFSSHLGVWQKIASGAATVGAVFEDDVHLAPDVGVLLSDSGWMPAEADIVRLESNSKMVLREGRRLAATPRRKIFLAASGTWGAAGYVITKRAAQRLIDLPPDQHTFIDSFLFKPTRSPVAASLRCYQVFPAVCIQDDYLNGKMAPMQSVVSSNVRTVPPPPKPRWFDGLLPGRKRAVPFRV